MNTNLLTTTYDPSVPLMQNQVYCKGCQYYMHGRGTPKENGRIYVAKQTTISRETRPDRKRRLEKTLSNNKGRAKW